MKLFGSAIILAGGKSRRMGYDKQLISINEKSLICAICESLKALFEDIVIVSNTPETYGSCGLKVISDIERGKGPLGGIHAGLSISGSRYAYVIACDMPNINMEYIEYMKIRIEMEIEEGNAVGACVTRQGEWIEPFNAFYCTEIVRDIESHLNGGRLSVGSLIEKIPTLYIEEQDARKFSPDWSMFFNMNTKEDIKRYIETIGKA